MSPDFRTWDIREAVRQVRCPTLVLQGLDDEYGTAAQVDAIASLVGGVVVPSMIQKCGHSPHRDQPAVVLDRLTAFMAHRHG